MSLELSRLFASLCHLPGLHRVSWNIFPSRRRSTLRSSRERRRFAFVMTSSSSSSRRAVPHGSKSPASTPPLRKVQCCPRFSFIRTKEDRRLEWSEVTNGSARRDSEQSRIRRHFETPKQRKDTHENEDSKAVWSLQPHSGGKQQEPFRKTCI